VFSLASPARAGDDYPYQDGDPSELDPYGFYYRNCTSFVAWRMSLRGEFSNYMRGGHWYHARNWADNARSLGIPVDEMPAPGAIAHWYAGEGGAGELGHVAVVESVNGDGSVFLEEYNGANPYGYARRGPTRAPRYIHLYDTGTAVQPSAAEPSRDPAPARTRSTVAAAPAVTRPVPAKARAEAEALPAPPSGRLTAPASGSRITRGSTVRVTGTFTDDSSVTKVFFYAADQHYRWKLIGFDAHGGNGGYSVNWRVNYAPGSRVSLYAEAFDDQGRYGVDTIRGVEGLRIVAPSKPAGAAKGGALRSATPAAHKAGLLGRVPAPYAAAPAAGLLASYLGYAFVWRRRRAAA
jgi:surface antigen